jgi:predicted amidohydrolase
VPIAPEVASSRLDPALTVADDAEWGGGMTRIVTVGAAQLGPVQRADSRAAVVKRMLDLLRQAHEHACDLVVFPELALTTFFPRWWMKDQEEIDSFFEREMPSNETAPLFSEARAKGIGFYLGFAELERANGRTHRFNTAILVDKAGKQVGKYRKIHLPGHAEHEPWRAFQHLEKRYFEVGNLGWPVWRSMGGLYGMCICNDRRWPETYRTMGLQGVEMVLLGYNTPRHNPPAPDHDRLSEFHNQLSMQGGAYANATWVVGVAKCGVEEGCEMIGNSSVIAPTGEVVAQALTQDDELIIARCDLDLGKSYKATTFNFERHRQPDQYRMIVERKGAVAPE